MKILGLALVAMVFVSGCTVHETYRYRSTPDTPKTVTLINWVTGEAVWSYEIPAGKQLNVSFDRSVRSAERQGYDEMRWNIGPLGDDRGGSSSVIRVPPPSQRRIELEVRASHELPPTAERPAPMPAPMGAPPPSSAPAAPASKAPSGIALPDPKQAAPK